MNFSACTQSRHSPAKADYLGKGRTVANGINRPIFCCALVTMVLVAAQAMGQGRYYPSRPTFSPWLYLYRGEAGPLDPYNAWVRPQFEYQDAMRAIESRFRQQEQNLNRLRQENTLLRESILPPTGVASRFMDYSHFFGGSGGSLRRPPERRLQIQSPSRLSNIAERYKRVY